MLLFVVFFFCHRRCCRQNILFDLSHCAHINRRCVAAAASAFVVRIDYKGNIEPWLNQYAVSIEV